MDFKKLLKKCDVSQSTITRTGVFYSINDKIVLEYMKSTKNIWIDDDIVPYIVDQKQAEADIREFFGNVKTVYFGLGLNSSIEARNKRIAEIFKEYGINLEN